MSARPLVVALVAAILAGSTALAHPGSGIVVDGQGRVPVTVGPDGALYFAEPRSDQRLDIVRSGRRSSAASSTRCRPRAMAERWNG